MSSGSLKNNVTNKLFAYKPCVCVCLCVCVCVFVCLVFPFFKEFFPRYQFM